MIIIVFEFRRMEAQIESKGEERRKKTTMHNKDTQKKTLQNR